MSTEQASSFSLFVSRIVWMMFGPLFLLLCAGKVISTGNGWFTPADVAFFVVLAITIFARWFEFYQGHPQTSTGEPAAPEDLRHYVAPLRCDDARRRARRLGGRQSDWKLFTR